MVGCFFAISIAAWQDTTFGLKQRRAYDEINLIFEKKLKNDVSYKDLCSKSIFQIIEEDFPPEANSFHVLIDDYSFGSFEGRVFFDTGEVFLIEFSNQTNGENKLSNFEKLIWPDRKNGETYWNNAR